MTEKRIDGELILRALDHIDASLRKLHKRIDDVATYQLQQRINSYTPEQLFKTEPPVDPQAGWPYSEADKRRRRALVDVERQISWHEQRSLRLNFAQSFVLSKQLSENTVPEPFEMATTAFQYTKRDLDTLAQWNEYGWFHQLTLRLSALCE